MKSKQKPESVTLEFPVTINFADLCTIQKAIEKAIDKQPRKKRARQSRVHHALS